MFTPLSASSDHEKCLVSTDSYKKAANRNKLWICTAFQSIFDKYEKDFSLVADEVDLLTGQIVVDKGHLKNLRYEGDLGTTDSPEHQPSSLTLTAIWNSTPTRKKPKLGTDSVSQYLRIFSCGRHGNSHEKPTTDLDEKNSPLETRICNVDAEQYSINRSSSDPEPVRPITDQFDETDSLLPKDQKDVLLVHQQPNIFPSRWMDDHESDHDFDDDDSVEEKKTENSPDGRDRAQTGNDAQSLKEGHNQNHKRLRDISDDENDQRRGRCRRTEDCERECEQMVEQKRDHDHHHDRYPNHDCNQDRRKRQGGLKDNHRHEHKPRKPYKDKDREREHDRQHGHEHKKHRRNRHVEVDCEKEYDHLHQRRIKHRSHENEHKSKYHHRQARYSDHTNEYEYHHDIGHQREREHANDREQRRDHEHQNPSKHRRCRKKKHDRR